MKTIEPNFGENMEMIYCKFWFLQKLGQIKSFSHIQSQQNSHIRIAVGWLRKTRSCNAILKLQCSVCDPYTGFQIVRPRQISSTRHSNSIILHSYTKHIILQTHCIRQSTTSKRYESSPISSLKEWFGVYPGIGGGIKNCGISSSNDSLQQVSAKNVASA